MSRTRALLMCGAAALTLVAASPGQVEAASRVEVALSAPRVDIIERDQIVASFDASGAIRGLFTVTLDRSEEGRLSGEWVLVSRYLIDVTPDGQPDALAADERAALPGAELHGRHREYVKFIDRGTLRGSVAGGTLDFDVDGRLRGISGLQLAVEDGSNDFKRYAGAASLTGTNLQSEAGIATLSFEPASAPAAAEVNQ